MRPSFWFWASSRHRTADTLPRGMPKGRVLWVVSAGKVGKGRKTSEAPIFPS